MKRIVCLSLDESLITATDNIRPSTTSRSAAIESLIYKALECPDVGKRGDL
jgi:hypothetical protein